uniref:Uncharacterized protein LOC114331070 isoform X1 n=1 Tax=Diabrotica virgifera virgifera TaxID=50390 RepID=A0A6P7FTQ8_DIAVI
MKILSVCFVVLLVVSIISASIFDAQGQPPAAPQNGSKPSKLRYFAGNIKCKYGYVKYLGRCIELF